MTRERGVRRGKKLPATVRDDGHVRATDLLQRDFTAARPDQRGAADLTPVATWSGVVYVVGVFSRAIVGWSATTERSELVPDAPDPGRHA